VSGSVFSVQCSEFGIQGLGSWDWDLESRVRVEGSGCRVRGSGFRVQGLELKVEEKGPKLVNSRAQFILGSPN